MWRLACPLHASHIPPFPHSSYCSSDAHRSPSGSDEPHLQRSHGGAAIASKPHLFRGNRAGLDSVWSQGGSSLLTGLPPVNCAVCFPLTLHPPGKVLRHDVVGVASGDHHVGPAILQLPLCSHTFFRPCFQALPWQSATSTEATVPHCLASIPPNLCPTKFMGQFDPFLGLLSGSHPIS